ncbi:MAG: hypothetical protein LBG43_11490 [Treponema sp.]|nr:hypothetical protein [Treponema sp.]
MQVHRFEASAGFYHIADVTEYAPINGTPERHEAVGDESQLILLAAAFCRAMRYEPLHASLHFPYAHLDIGERFALDFLSQRNGVVVSVGQRGYKGFPSPLSNK